MIKWWCTSSSSSLVRFSLYISTLRLLISLHYFSSTFTTTTTIMFAAAAVFAMPLCFRLLLSYFFFLFSCALWLFFLFYSAMLLIDLNGKNIRFSASLDFPLLSSVLRVCCHDSFSLNLLGFRMRYILILSTISNDVCDIYQNTLFGYFSFSFSIEQQQTFYPNRTWGKRLLATRIYFDMYLTQYRLVWGSRYRLILHASTKMTFPILVRHLVYTLSSMVLLAQMKWWFPTR